jgi:hypothetical protein
MIRWLTRHVVGIPLALTTLAFAAPAFAQDEELEPLPLPPLPPPPPPAPPPGAEPPTSPPSSGTAVMATPAAGGQKIPLEQVRFEPDEPELTLMMQTGERPVSRIQRFRHAWYYEHGVAPSYSPICEGPCDTRLVPGAYRLALSRDGGTPVSAGVVAVEGPSTITATYEDHSGARVFGGLIIVGGLIGGVAMIVSSADHQMCDSNACSTDLNGSLLGGGIAVVLGSVIIGSLLASEQDAAHVTVTPLTLPVIGARKEAPTVAALGALPPPQGAALKVSF